MNIVVCISSVPDTTSKINFTENNREFDKNGIQFVINPYDEFGLTKAMTIKESMGGVITVITVGSVEVEPVIRKTLAIGADKAVRINMSPTDSYSTATEISNYIKKNPADLIIAGRESIDYNGGAVPGIISELLELPFINACIGLNISERSAEIIREIDGGKETILTKLPVVIGGQKGLVEEADLRIPNMRGIMQARNKPLEVIEPSNADPLTMSVAFEKLSKKNACKLVNADEVDILIKLLQNEAKVI